MLCYASTHNYFFSSCEIKKDTALGKLNDKLINTNGKARLMNLEEFNVKKLNIQAFEEWETVSFIYYYDIFIH